MNHKRIVIATEVGKNHVILTEIDKDGNAFLTRMDFANAEGFFEKAKAYLMHRYTKGNVLECKFSDYKEFFETLNL